MRWLKKTAIVGTIAAVGVSASLLAQSAGRQGSQEKTTPKKDSQVRVFEQVRGLFGSGGARLGVSLREVDEDAARERKLPAQEGALVEDVAEDSAAAKAGVKTGDVIVDFDGERVRSVRQLQRLVSDTPPGRTVKLSVLRDGKRTDLTVTPDEAETPMSLGRLDPKLDAEIRRGVEQGLRDFPREFHFEGPDVYRFERRPPGDEAEAQERRRPEGPAFRVEPRWPLFQWSEGAGRLGAAVQELTPQLQDYFGAEGGVLVSSVNPESAASRAGLKAGDVIVSVQGKKVSSPGELVRALRDAGEDAEVDLGIVRDRKDQTLKVKLGSGGDRRVWHT